MSTADAMSRIIKEGDATSDAKGRKKGCDLCITSADSCRKRGFCYRNGEFIFRPERHARYLSLDLPRKNAIPSETLKEGALQNLKNVQITQGIRTGGGSFPFHCLQPLPN